MKEPSTARDTTRVQAQRSRRLQSTSLQHQSIADREAREDSVRSQLPTQIPSAVYIGYMIGLLCIVNVLNYMDRMALSVLMPLIKADLALSDGQLGMLVGFAFFLFYAICGIPIARWADRGIRRNIIAATLTIWSVMTALNGAAQNFWHLLLARVGVGAGEAGAIPAGASIIADYVPFRRRSIVYAIYTFFSVMGTVVGMIAAGLLGEMIGWRWTFVVLGLPGILLAGIVRFTLQEPVRGASDGSPELKHDRANPSLHETIRTLWQCRSYRLMVACFVLGGFNNMGLTQWWPSFYGRIFGIGISSVGVHLGLAIGVGSAIGTIVGGIVCSKAEPRNIRLPLLVAAGAVALAMIAALGALFVTSLTASITLVCMAAAFTSVPAGAMTSTLYTVVQPRMRATGAALNIFAIAVLGFGLGPFCVGVLSDLLAPSLGVEALRYAMLLPACILVLMIGTLYLSTTSLAGDLRAAGVSVK